MYRIILVFSACFVLVLRYFIIQENPHAYDPFEIRIGLTAVLFAVLFISFFSAFSRRLTFLNYLIFLLFSVHSLVLIVKNEFASSYILEFLILVTIISIALKKKKLVYVYLSVIFVIYSVLSILQLTGLKEQMLHVGLFAIFVLGLTLLLDLKTYFETKLIVKDTLLNKVFDDSPDALFIVESESGEILNFNKRSESIFENVESFTTVLHIFKRQYNMAYWKEMTATAGEQGKIVGDNEFVKKAGGESFWGRLTVSPLILVEKNYFLVRISDITDRVKDKRAFEESRKILLKVINLLPHQVFVKDATGKFILINRAVADIHGLPARELVGKTDFDLLPEGQAEKSWKLEKEVLEKKKTVIIPEEKYYSASGKVKYMHSTKMPFFLNEKDEVGLLGVNLDITENKEAERVIRESEAKYKMLMEQASDGIVISDKDGYVTEANAKACELFGYPLIEFKSLNLSSLLTDDAEENTEDGQWYLKESVILERNFRRKNGRQITLELSTKSLPDGRNQAILRDITERKEMEKVLTESERKFRVLIENSSEITAILSSDFNFTFISNSAERILGLDPDSFLGKSVEQFIPDDDKNSFIGLLKESLEQPGKNLQMEEVKWKYFRSRETRVLEIVVVNLLNDPAINGIVINCHDITKRKNTESELINTNFELDSFVYKASHDLKAPLRSIMGLIKLARLETQDEVQHNYLNMMSKSVSSLDQFIKDLTQFSRNNRLEIEAKLIDFDSLILEALNNLQFFDHADKVKICKRFVTSVPFYSDVTRISTILNNLISNAFKYHRFENNDPYINIDIVTTLEYAEIRIQDNGQGIDAKYLGRIFEMFYRASESSYGSGLGLYIVKNAVARLEGEIRVHSVLNEGSEFVVKLPNLINDI